MASEIRVNQIQNRSGLGTVTFTDTGAVLSGIVTVAGNLKGPSEVDATTVTATTVTATTVKVGTAVTISAGVVTATSFSGDGSGLSGIDASSLKSGGVVKVQANSSGAVISGVATATQITVGNSFIKDEAVGLGTTTTTGRDAGISTAPGTMIFLPDVGLQVYAGNNKGWRTVAGTNNVQVMEATGGVTATYPEGGKTYKSHLFTSSGTFAISELGGNNGQCDIIIVGGGGGGGRGGGGGGAGGVCVTQNTQLGGVPGPNSYTVTIGGGGAGGPQSGTYRGATGGESTISNPVNPNIITGKGGGGGQEGGAPAPAGNSAGGSGGGCGHSGGTPQNNAGPANQPAQTFPLVEPSITQKLGYPGGGPGSSTYTGGGGGGAGGAGGPATPVLGLGGNAITNTYADGTDVVLAGGGGGGTYPSGTNAGGGAGGTTVGGEGNNSGSGAGAAVANTGSGGGGGGGGGAYYVGGNGSGGYICIRYETD